MIQEIKIKELSETEELSNNYSITIPERFLHELDWSDEYCTKLTLDKVHNQIIISQSDIKVKNNLKPLVSKEQFFIIEQVEKGKSYKEIAKELNSTASSIKFRYENACLFLKEYINKKLKKNQIGMPKDFQIPAYLFEEVEKEKKEREENKIKKILTERHAFILEQRAKGKSYTEIAKELNISAKSVNALFYRSCRYLSDYSKKRINLEMPEGFTVTKEIKKVVEEKLNTKISL